LFFFQAEDGIRDRNVTGVQTCALPISSIRIDGENVPFGPQPFGLCITGGIGTNAGIVTLDRVSYGSASTVEVQVTDTNAPASVKIGRASCRERVEGGEVGV